VADRGIADRVTLAGVMDSAALTEAYQTSDLFVLASKYEGFGMAFVEAMSHGLPVIGLECDAVAEATKGAAVLVRPEDLSGTLSTHILSTDARMALADRCWLAAQTFLRWRETASIVTGALAAAPR
ncbi:MAG: glycosyltransferase, partial [Pseudomonadota bacterium]